MCIRFTIKVHSFQKLLASKRRIVFQNSCFETSKFWNFLVLKQQNFETNMFQNKCFQILLFQNFFVKHMFWNFLVLKHLFWNFFVWNSKILKKQNFKTSKWSFSVEGSIPPKNHTFDTCRSIVFGWYWTFNTKALHQKFKTIKFQNKKVLKEKNFETTKFCCFKTRKFENSCSETQFSVLFQLLDLSVASEVLFKNFFKKFLMNAK